MQAAPAMVDTARAGGRKGFRSTPIWRCNPSMAPSPRLPKSSQSPLAGAFQSLHTGAALRSARSGAQAAWIAWQDDLTGAFLSNSKDSILLSKSFEIYFSFYRMEFMYTGAG